MLLLPKLPTRLAPVLLLLVGSCLPVVAQSQFVDPKAGRDCGCTLRKWPLLSDFVSKVMPSLNTMQPEVFLPHYADAGCGSWPRLPAAGIYGEVRYSTLASLDLFIDHDWHDFTFFTRLGGDAYKLNSATNQRNDNSFLCYNQNNSNCPSVRGETVMEIEWDTKHYPERFWASVGDQVWMTGRYIWDCGHPPNYHTEIHAPKALALTRPEPYVFPGDNSPSLTNKTYIYIHGRSGVKNYNFKTVEGVESIVFNGYKDLPVANQNYEFDVPLPPRPSTQSRAVARVLELPFGGPAPELTIDAGQRFVRVKYPLNLNDSSPDRKFAAVIASGWQAPVESVRFRRITVRIEQLQILKPHNAVSASDWKLWLNINGQWARIEGLPGQDRQNPLDSLLNIDRLLGPERPLVRIEKTFDVILPETSEATLTIQVAGWVNFYDSLFGVREDVLATSLSIPSALPQALSRLSTSDGRIGVFFRQFSRADNFGIGRHNQQRGNYLGELSRGHELIDGVRKSYEETDGDFALAYTIEER
jgi:hypothetical protein